VLASGSIKLNVILSAIICFTLGYQKIVLVPPEITREFWVSTNKVSPAYLSAMSIFLAEIRLNVTSSNAPIQRDLFLRYEDPENYEKLKSTLIDEEEQLKKEHISMTFFMTSAPLIDQKNMVAKIAGDVQYMVSGISQPIQHANYQISYKLDAGRLMIDSFEEVKAHA
jgi:conjugal transfer pilus assembly protein TraE